MARRNDGCSLTRLEDWESISSANPDDITAVLRTSLSTYSVECGVQELKAALEAAEVENPMDMERIKLTLKHLPGEIILKGGFLVRSVLISVVDV